jgi:hypothetical protein
LEIEIDHVLTALKMAFSLLLIALSFPLAVTFQRLMSINYHAEYTFEVLIGSQMSDLGTFCLVSMLLMLGSWGMLSIILTKIGGSASARKRELQVIVLFVLVILLIGIVIAGSYFGQKVDRWIF